MTLNRLFVLSDFVFFVGGGGVYSDPHPLSLFILGLPEGDALHNERPHSDISDLNGPGLEIVRLGIPRPGTWRKQE